MKRQGPDALLRVTLVTSKEAAKMLGIKAQTLRRWRYKGKGPRYIRLGENSSCPAGYRLSDLEHWIEEHTFSTTAAETVAAD